MFWTLIGLMRASLVQIGTEMAERYAKQQQPAVCSMFAFGRCAAGCVSINGPGDVDIHDFLTTGMQVASKIGNLHSEFGHARPLGS